jgi:hypothetical protein
MVEGYSIPYRAVMTSLPVGTPITLILGYDIKHSGANAIDYLTHYDRLLPHGFFGHAPEVINPVGNFPELNAIAPTTIPIKAPADTNSPVPGQPTASFNALPANEKVMTLWGGTLTNFDYATQGDLTAASAETTIAVSFTPTSATAVLAWGGHIARGDQWNGASAGAISGSPYHMRTKTWNLNNLGNQDRSLSAAAVIAPPKLIVIKQVVNDDGGTKVASDFTINVSGNPFAAMPASFAGQAAPGTEVQFADTSTYAVTEPAVAGYSTTYSADCSGTITPEQTKTCTVTNNDVPPTLKLVKNVTNNDGGTAVPNNWTLSATAPAPNDGRNFSNAGGSGAFQTVFAGAGYALAETAVAGYAAGSWSCDGGSLSGSTVTLSIGQNVTCTITNNDVAPTLKLV